jgi:HSP20 family protein
MSFLTPWGHTNRRHTPATFTGSANLINQFDRAFGDIFNDGFYVSPQRGSSVGPQSYVATDDVEHRISIALPGVPKDAVDVTVGDNTLIVGYEASGDDYNSAVFSTSFTKSWTLPEGIDVEGIAAMSDNGILTITVPRTHAKASEGRTIAVK